MTIPLEYIDDIASTSEELKRRAEADAAEHALCARRQTAGRGRLGRSWQTIDGNLHLSVLLRPAQRIMPGHWSLLSAVALADTVIPFAGPGALRLKWPNDMLLHGGKAGGVLLECAMGARAWLVIGFGVNLAGAPATLGRAVASLEGSGAPAAPEFARLLLASISRWRERYQRDGFEPVRDRWRALGPDADAPLVVGAGDRQVHGAFRGIGQDGSLLLETADGPATVVSGDVQ